MEPVCNSESSRAAAGGDNEETVCSKGPFETESAPNSVLEYAASEVQWFVASSADWDPDCLQHDLLHDFVAAQVDVLAAMPSDPDMHLSTIGHAFVHNEGIRSATKRRAQSTFGAGVRVFD